MTIIRNHYQVNHRRASSKAQTGAVLLIFLLILITGASYSLLNQLNAATKLHTRQQETNRALSEAKQALIGYAITYPDKVNSNAGPGYLPCPDLDNDGDAEGGCALAGPINWTIGRFPNETLNVQELKDASGQRLWYVLSDNFRNFAGFEPLNSDTPGQLCIDVNFDGDCDVVADGDIDDIVAIIIAPGAPVDGQNRDPNETDIANEISNYLEADNKNFDTVFVTYDDDGDNDGDLLDEDFNDILILITRQELVRSMEKRALVDVSNSLERFRNSFGVGNEAYPWLAPFSDPSTSNYLWTANTYEGHLPLHIPGLAYVNNAAYTATWNGLTGGTYTQISGSFPNEDCLRNSSCISQFGAFDATPLITNATCTWINRFSFNCSSTLTDIWPVAFPGVSRTYTLTYTDDSANAGAAPVFAATPPASALVPRTRGLSINGVFRGQISITVTDTGTQVGSASLIINPDSINAGIINLTGMDYHLDTVGVDLNGDGDVIDAGEQGDLPDWLLDNNWHHFTYVAYPPNETIPGAGTDVCTSVGFTPCLTVNGINDVRALAMIAGKEDPGAGTPQTRPSGSMLDYFEDGNNTTGDNIYVESSLSSSFNDQLIIISQ